MRYQPSKSKERDLSCFNQCLRKRQAKHSGLASMSEQSSKEGGTVLIELNWQQTKTPKESLVGEKGSLDAVFHTLLL